MGVDVVRLVEALKRVAWQHGLVRTELLRHRIQEDGSHRIELVLQSADIACEPSKHASVPPGFATPEVKGKA
jgi:hypothetical protein